MPPQEMPEEFGTGNTNGEEDSGGVQAVDTAMRVLSALIDMGPPLMLKTVAARAHMHPPKAHRYLVSFCRSGLAERDPRSGGYKLGPLAVRLGLTALRHLDVVQVASSALASLRDELGFSVALAVWGTGGPTFVRVEETNDAIIISGRPGSIMPILRSSTGRVFAAYLPRSLVQDLLLRELEGGSGASEANPEAIFEQVRKDGLATIRGDVNPGVHGISAPIFDHTGTIAGVITVSGTAGAIETRLDGPIARTLVTRAAEISKRPS